MTAIDIIILIPLLWALISGWRKGVVRQIGALVGLVVGVFLAWHLGGWVVGQLGVTSTWGIAGVYIGVALLALLLVILGARLIGGIFKVTGLGPFDRLAGSLFSLVKIGLIVGLLLCCFQWVNDRTRIVGEETLNSSVLYWKMLKVPSYAFPYMAKACDKITDWSSCADE